ncbi:MAG TPA: hypoxanthine phosphoribosyltransferase [Candidatus Methylacidiphilales bacterium]|nr:hypoxanthine phosphoribosyltransferase [Candidatus Methylacidiphilales bacterium]
MRAPRQPKHIRPSLNPGRLLLSQAQIHARVRHLGRAITRHYAGQAPLFLGIMNGALLFLADLLRAVDLDSEVTCVRLASYAGTESTGKLRGLEAMGDSFKGRHVVIVDDILDTGATLTGVITRLRELGAADVKVCVLLQKKKAHLPVKVDWTGFTIPDQFVVGYGLDYNGRYRGLKQIRLLETPAV